MNLFERIKRIFFKEKIKALPEESTNIQKIVLLATNERNPQNVLNLLASHACEMKSSDIIKIISRLPMKYRIEAIDISHKYITPYDLADLAINKLSTIGKIEVLDRHQYGLDLEDVYLIFDSITPDYRILALEKSIDRFDSYGCAELIKKYVPLYERLDILNKYKKDLDGSAKASIIENLDSDRKVEALKLYADEISPKALESIVKETEPSRVADVLSVVFYNMSQEQIADCIKYYVTDDKKLQMLYKCCYKLDSALISDLIKFTIPQEDKEEALVALQNRMEKNNVGEVFQFCTTSLSVLDKIKNNLYVEDLEYFQNIAK